MKNIKTVTTKEGNAIVTDYVYNGIGKYIIKTVEVIGSLKTVYYYLDKRGCKGDCIEIIIDNNFCSGRKIVEGKEVAYLSYGAKNSYECTHGAKEDINKLTDYLMLVM